MTKNEILAMQPGEDLNVKVAEEIMKHKVVKDKHFGYTERLVNPEDGSSVWADVQPYSEDISVAEVVIEKMIEMGYEDAIHWADFGDGKYTEAEAICKSALLALLNDGKLDEPGDKILRQALGEELE
ncbi:MAG: hypothetical protein JW967_10915 [Dehalococcoidales bacterium]|nr:hypothetical protein [Dehalococcoidales bacterium]